MQPVFQQNSQRRSVRHAELLAVRARVSSQRPFLTGGGFLVLVISCGRDAAKLFPQFPGTGCFLPLAVSYRRPFPVAFDKKAPCVGNGFKKENSLNVSCSCCRNTNDNLHLQDLPIADRFLAWPTTHLRQRLESLTNPHHQHVPHENRHHRSH